MNANIKTPFDYKKLGIILVISGPVGFALLIFMLLTYAYLLTIGIMDPSNNDTFSSVIKLLLLLGFGISFIGMFIVFPVTLINLIIQIIRNNKK